MPERWYKHKFIPGKMGVGCVICGYGAKHPYHKGRKKRFNWDKVLSRRPWKVYS